jgi:F-type H+-transporting ATPase subunit b
MEALGLNPGFVIAQLVNFGLFALLAYFVGWRPLMSMLDNRAEKIAKGLEDARVAAERRAVAETEAEKVLSNARAEAQRIVAEARASAEERARPIVHAAEADADRIRSEAQVRADEAQASALSGLRGQVVTLAIAAANRVIGDALKDKNQAEKVVNDFFSTSTVDLRGLSGDNIAVTTALPLTDAEKSKVEASLGGKVTQWNVDPSILGGIVVRAGDRVVDGSVRASLGSLSASLN